MCHATCPSDAAGAEAEDAARELEEADSNLGRSIAVFPLAVTRLMKRLNEQGVGACTSFCTVPCAIYCSELLCDTCAKVVLAGQCANCFCGIK